MAAFNSLFRKLNKPAIQSKKDRNFDRSFILIGTGGGWSGKSTLGNLLLGYKLFKEHQVRELSGLTCKVQSGDCSIESCEVCDNLNEFPNEMLNFQVLDQPGLNDYNFTQENYCTFLKECIAETKAEMSASFLILIGLDSYCFTSVVLLPFLNLAEILSDSAYSFFSNAIVVFTHADRVVPDMNQDELKEILQAKLETEEFEAVQDMIDLVDRRYIFVNAEDRSTFNRTNILKTLFELTRPNLNVYINGNNAFKGDELKVLFGESEETKSFKRQSLKYDVEYHFNRDLNLFKKSASKEIGEKFVNTLENLGRISNGISTIVLLINFEELFNIEMYNLIVNIPNLGEPFDTKLWNYACIMFRVPVDSEEFIKKNVESNRLLKSLAVKVNYRYAWVTERISPEECSRKLIDLARRVKQEREGKYYTDRVVLARMKQIIEESIQLKKSDHTTRMVGDIEDKYLCQYIPFYKIKSDSRVIVSNQYFFWRKEIISPLLGYYILLEIDPSIAALFRQRYPDKERGIPTEEYVQYCLKIMKRCFDNY